MRVIAVVGKGQRCPDDVAELAYAVGRALAAIEDVVLVTGGLGGVMDAAARGFADAQRGPAARPSIGLVPAGREDDASRAHSIALRVGVSPHVRNAMTASVCDAMIVCPGSHGTLQEASMASEAGKPVVAVGAHAILLPDVTYVETVERAIALVR